VPMRPKCFLLIGPKNSFVLLEKLQPSGRFTPENSRSPDMILRGCL
jgi:hypothetical protein